MRPTISFGKQVNIGFYSNYFSRRIDKSMMTRIKCSRTTDYLLSHFHCTLWGLCQGFLRKGDNRRMCLFNYSLSSFLYVALVFSVHIHPGKSPMYVTSFY